MLNEVFIILEYKAMQACGCCRFDFDAMLDLKGNTAVYLLYAYARISSILSKAGHQEGARGTLERPPSIQLEHPDEIDIALHMIR